MARFKSRHAKVTIIQSYSPTNKYGDDDKERFYQHLQDLVNKVPSHNVSLITGDLNAQIGVDRDCFKHVRGPHTYGDNGDRFI